ncbi:MAG: hypothetical protein ACRERD_22720 [Candidatus Binatia bacterium]
MARPWHCPVFQRSLARAFLTLDLAPARRALCAAAVYLRRDYTGGGVGFSALSLVSPSLGDRRA